MVKIRTLVGLMSVAFLITCFSSCKKEKESEVSFNTTTVSLDAKLNPTATVTVNLSQPVNGVVELWLQNIGPDTFQFGSFAQRFINDDSARILGVLGVLASIDTPIVGNIAHITLGQGSSNFTLALTALFDNFPKRAVQYRIKIVSVKNGSIVSGKDVLTINIAASPMTPVFTSSLTMKDVIYDFDTVFQYNNVTLQFDTIYKPDSIIVNSNYGLSSFAFVPAATQGTYNFSLSYSKLNGNDTASTFNLSCNGITPSVGANTYPTSDGEGSITTHFILSPTANPVRGNYYIMNSTPGAITWSNGGHRMVAADTLACSFIVF